MNEKKYIVDKILKLDKKKKVKFIVIYGSYLTDKYTPISDIDVAIFYEENEKERFKFRLKCLGDFSDKYDIHIFQDLPMHIKNEVIKTGEYVYKKDESETIDIVIQNIRKYARFERHVIRCQKAIKGY
jgi:uncharacterized protein